jgi:hypothetical protein
VNIHVFGDTIKDALLWFAVGGERQHILFMAREGRHFTLFASFAVQDVDDELALDIIVHICDREPDKYRSVKAWRKSQMATSWG